MRTLCFRIVTVLSVAGLPHVAAQEKPAGVSGADEKRDRFTPAGTHPSAPRPPKESFLPNAHGEYLPSQVSIHTVRVTPDGNYLFSGASDGTIRSWNLLKRKLAWEIRPALAKISCFALSPDSRTVFAAVHVSSPRRHGHSTHETDIWVLQFGGVLGRLMVHPGSISCLEVSPDGKSLAAADGTDTVRLWHSGSGREMSQFVHSDKQGRGKYSIDGVKFSPDGKTITTWTGSQHVWLWDVDSGKVRKRLDTELNSIGQLVFTPNGKKFIAVRGIPIACDIATGELTQFKHMVVNATGHWVTSLAISPDGKLLVSAGSESTVRLWEMATFQEFESIGVEARSQWTGAAAAASLTFTPDSKFIIGGCQDNSLLFWEWSRRLPGECDGKVLTRSTSAVAPAWKMLTDGDAVVGQRGVRTLIANPDVAVRLAGEKMAPIPIPEKATIALLIETLDHPESAERDRAVRGLAEYREAVRDELNAAIRDHQSAEACKRCRQLVAALNPPLHGERLG